MDEEEVLEALSSGEFVVTIHGLERMLQRRVLEVDIVSVAKSCSEIFKQNHGTWKIDGLDTHNSPLTVIAAEENGVVIVTVY